jgi:LysM repeat protein
MKEMRQVVLGILAALFSTALVLGGLSVTMVEGGQRIALFSGPISIQLPTVTPSLTATPQPTIPTPLPGTPTFTPTATPPPSSTPTLPPTPTSSCPAPPGWTAITIQPEDSLQSLADQFNTTKEILKKNNCLVTESIIAGYSIYVPNSQPSATSTPLPTSTTCGPPAGWILYTVQPFDNLFRLALKTNTSVYALEAANCLNSDNIIVGQKIYLPSLPATATATHATPRTTSTRAPTSTSVPTNFPTRTPTPTGTQPPTLVHTSTNTPVTPTPTSSLTLTPQPPTATPVTPTDTPIPTDTPVPTNTSPPTNTSVPSDTPTTIPSSATAGP